jgi:cell wall-associated NlpC family hydrolase
MRKTSLLLLVLGGALWAGACSRTSTPRMPRDALLTRARSGREPIPTERGRAVVAFAAAQIGKPYCWGGTGPSCFDCSGLAETAWSQVGVRVPRTSHDIAGSLPEVALSEVRAGDILWWPGHVGLYAGNGMVVDALDSRHGVVVRAATDPYRAFRPAIELTQPGLIGLPAYSPLASGR